MQQTRFFYLRTANVAQSRRGKKVMYQPLKTTKAKIEPAIIKKPSLETAILQTDLTINLPINAINQINEYIVHAIQRRSTSNLKNHHQSKANPIYNYIEVVTQNPREAKAIVFGLKIAVEQITSIRAKEKTTRDTAREKIQQFNYFKQKEIENNSNLEYYFLNHAIFTDLLRISQEPSNTLS